MYNFKDDLNQDSKRKTMLYYWYMEDVNCAGIDFTIMHGIVSGHHRLMDSTFINTSLINSYTVNYDDSELVVQTENTVYHCPLAYCNFDQQDLVKNQIPDYEKIKRKYKGRAEKEQPTADEGEVLLVISNHDGYYFNSLYYKPKGAYTKVKYFAGPHIGTFQDSFLIRSGEGDIDLRYFPHSQNIEFYTQDTDNMPFYIENIGDITLYCRTFSGVIKLDPGERKKVTKENAEKVSVDLPDNDLYPAAFISDKK